METNPNQSRASSHPLVQLMLSARSAVEGVAIPGQPGALAVETATVAPGGLAADAEANTGNGTLQRRASPAALSVRAFLAAGAMPSAAAVEALVLRALVGGPSSACLAAFLGLAAV